MMEIMNWLSYLTPLFIYKGKTKSGDIIEIREIFGHKKLDIGGYPQSGASYRRCWKNILSRSNIYKLANNSRVLILGLGGGDLVKILKQNKSLWHLTIVELEDEVIKIAKKYFEIESSSKIKIVRSDAKIFIQNNISKYDLIIVDLYSGDDVPKFVTTGKFLKNISIAIKPMGYILFNYASHSFHEHDFVTFKNRLKKIFSQVDILRDWGHSFYLTQKLK